MKLKFVAWNVNRKSFDNIDLPSVLNLNADIIAFQEIRPKKSSEEFNSEITEDLSKYLPIWCNIGHGLASFSKLRNFQKVDIDFDGQVMTFEFENFYFVNVSVPPISYIGEEDFLDWNRYFKNFINRLHQKKAVIAGGTFNFGTNPNDISPAESKAMEKLLKIGLIDTFQILNPDKDDAYTSRNRRSAVESRIDYFFVSNILKDKIISASIVEEDFGSAHRPIVLEIDI